jgi:hypothetical protein
VISTVQAAAGFRPKPELLRSGLIGTAVVTAALFGSLYVVTWSTPWLLLVLALHVVGMLVVGFWTARYFTPSIRFSGDSVTLRTFPFPTRVLPLSAVSHQVLAQVYVGNTDDTHTHLAVLDSRSNQLFRLRTRFWSLEDITRVAELLGAPMTTLPSPLSPSEFNKVIRRTVKPRVH